MLQRLSRSTNLWKQISSKGYLGSSGTSFSHRFATQPDKSKEDDDSFELLPPGCSMVDPTYGIRDNETTVLFYEEEDTTQTKASTPKRTDKPVPSIPTNMAAAQRSLKEAKDNEDEDTYVYLPPGCSVREPGYNSMSDPLDKQLSDRRVYVRDPKISSLQDLADAEASAAAAVAGKK